MQQNVLITTMLLLTGALFATEHVVTRMVTIPIYHKKEDAKVKFVRIPHVGWDLNDFWHCELISLPFIAGHSNLEQDINLISLYQIEVHYTYKDQLHHIDIITANATKPDGYKFAVKDVAVLTVHAIQMDFPDASLAIIYIDGAPFTKSPQSVQTRAAG